MGDLNIGVTDLAPCKECGYQNSMIFDGGDDGWFIACGYRKCEHRTVSHAELLDACSDWGLKPTDATE